MEETKKQEEAAQLGIGGVSNRFYLWFSMKKGWINATLWLFKSDFNNFIWFQKRSFKCLVGKEGIMDSREVNSKGGYKYLQLEISKMPVSKTDVVS